MKRNEINKKAYLKLSKEIMVELKKPEISLTKLIRNGVQQSTAVKVSAIKQEEDYLKLLARTVYSVCVAIDTINAESNSSYTKHFEKDFEKIFKPNELLLNKWHKALLSAKEDTGEELSNHVITMRKRGVYSGKKKYNYTTKLMIDILDYAEDLQEEFKYVSVYNKKQGN